MIWKMVIKSFHESQRLDLMFLQLKRVKINYIFFLIIFYKLYIIFYTYYIFTY